MSKLVCIITGKVITRVSRDIADRLVAKGTAKYTTKQRFKKAVKDANKKKIAKL